ncbi:hypothetical protein [Altererythrobacter aquiaggeris]|uniref:hypothetical protein n=1 Tax=Aestuarierythrobacter aquiaggeris TaxID=1898396 RepID=UPI003019B9BF
MATAKRRSNSASTHNRGSRRGWRRGWAITAAVTAVIAGGVAYNWSAISGFTNAGASYSARVVCSCRHAGGRSLDDCRKDLLGGMELVSLTEDKAEKSITARYPLMIGQTARWREGYGCVMDKWEG